MLLIFIIITVLIIRDHPYALSSIDTSFLQEKENSEENRSITSNISFFERRWRYKLLLELYFIHVKDEEVRLESKYRVVTWSLDILDEL